jgi:DNA replicative helicase MCM subunit Mcm2 (Cdc46/Mcm family)
MFKLNKQTYYCEPCKQEIYLNFKDKKICPNCKTALIPIHCSQEDFQKYSPEEQEILIESNILQERTKKTPYTMNTQKMSVEEQIQKIYQDIAFIKWSMLGFMGLCMLIYLFEELL